MATAFRMKDEINTLKHDAAKVLQDISKLSSHLRDAGSERVSETSSDISKSMHETLDEYKHKLAELNRAMGKYTSKVHTSVKANPYPYIAGAIGAGFLLGKFLIPNSRQDS